MDRDDVINQIASSTTLSPGKKAKAMVQAGATPEQISSMSGITRLSEGRKARMLAAATSDTQRSKPASPHITVNFMDGPRGQRPPAGEDYGAADYERAMRIREQMGNYAVPEVPKGPEVPEVPKGPEVPEGPEGPEGPEVPEDPEAVLQFEYGGKVPGKGSGDKVHILAEPGEYVIPKEVVERKGTEFFEKLINPRAALPKGVRMNPKYDNMKIIRDLPRGPNVQRLQPGGKVLSEEEKRKQYEYRTIPGNVIDWMRREGRTVPTPTIPFKGPITVPVPGLELGTYRDVQFDLLPSSRPAPAMPAASLPATQALPKYEYRTIPGNVIDWMRRKVRTVPAQTAMPSNVAGSPRLEDWDKWTPEQQTAYAREKTKLKGLQYVPPEQRPPGFKLSQFYDPETDMAVRGYYNPMEAGINFPATERAMWSTPDFIKRGVQKVMASRAPTLESFMASQGYDPNMMNITQGIHSEVQNSRGIAGYDVQGNPVSPQHLQAALANKEFMRNWRKSLEDEWAKQYPEAARQLAMQQEQELLGNQEDKTQEKRQPKIVVKEVKADAKAKDEIPMSKWLDIWQKDRAAWMSSRYEPYPHKTIDDFIEASRRQPGERRIIKKGTMDGERVVMYSDGSIEYAK